MDHPLYPLECALRENVLLRPLGFDMGRFRQEFAGVEERLEHFVAVFDQQGNPVVIGCGALLANEPKAGSGRLMQMAVDPQRQGEGIGRRVVVAVESRAFGELKLTELVCHVQLHMMGFYERLGWEVDSEVFTEAGILHRRMVIRNPVITDE
jgi:predicted GNAT family N-acyltransferase